MAVAVLLVGALLVVRGVADGGAGAAASTPRASGVPGAPDLTGAGSRYGQVSLVALRARAAGAQVTDEGLTFDGIERAYLVIAPPKVTQPLPMLLVLHGVNESATQEVIRDEFLPLAAAGKAIVVYPGGYDESWNAGAESCCGSAGTLGIDDTGFVAQVVSQVRAANKISTVDLVGYSNGGKLAFDLMCKEPALFGAVAVVAAVPIAACRASTQPAKPIYISVGMQDTKLPMDTASQAAPVAFAAGLATWRARDGCDSSSTSHSVGTATITTWGRCADGTRVAGASYTGLAHDWPASGQVGVAASGATLIWDFFSMLGSPSQ